MTKHSLMGRLAEAIFIIFCVISINFFLIRLVPGDPVVHIIGETEYSYLEMNSPEVIEKVRAEYGLDKSFLEQYRIYLNKMIHLDFGTSYSSKEPVLKTIWFRMQWTLCLAIPATVISALLGGILGLWAGWRPGKKFDLIASPCFMGIYTIPTNCLAILILITFAFKTGWFPISGITTGGLEGTAKILDILHHMVLPMLVLILYKTASNYMLMKSTVTLIRKEEYITTAISKGLPRRKVLSSHVLRNALCPYITSVCMEFGSMLIGSMMVEIVFSWKGMGTLIYESVKAKDFPVLQACFLFISVFVVVFNLLADVINTLIDPRVKEGLKHAA